MTKDDVGTRVAHLSLCCVETLCVAIFGKAHAALSLDTRHDAYQQLFLCFHETPLHLAHALPTPTMHADLVDVLETSCAILCNLLSLHVRLAQDPLSWQTLFKTYQRLVLAAAAVEATASLETAYTSLWRTAMEGLHPRPASEGPMALPRVQEDALLATLGCSLALMGNQQGQWPRVLALLWKSDALSNSPETRTSTCPCRPDGA